MTAAFGLSRIAAGLSNGASSLIRSQPCLGKEQHLEYAPPLIRQTGIWLSLPLFDTPLPILAEDCRTADAGLSLHSHRPGRESYDCRVSSVLVVTVKPRRKRKENKAKPCSRSSFLYPKIWKHKRRCADRGRPMGGSGIYFALPELSEQALSSRGSEIAKILPDNGRLKICQKGREEKQDRKLREVLL